MKVPYSWLSEHVDLAGVDPNEVARLLTLHTCEVDAVHHVGAGLEAIVIGEVVECGKHPGADNLRITKVNAGIGEVLPIVCGAPNVAKGQKVAIVLPGTRLPGGLEVGERKIRGEVSRGMICSEKELGLGEDHDGIVVLEPDAVVGRKLRSLPSIEDWVLEIDNKSVNHRPDLWGIYGFARELKAIVPRAKLRAPKLADLEFAPAGSRGAFRVAIEEAALCPRYLAVSIEGIRVGEAPAWMRRRLRLVGARAISSVVDVTNYVMFELGQPTHAFDRAKLEEGRIVVRRARAGETLTTLDQQKRSLVSTDLVIADGRRAVGLAGVMGGADSEVRRETTAIVLESATFDAVTIRRTAARLALRSEASSRFEKSLDPWLATDAARRIVALLAEGFGADARVAGPVSVAGPEPPKARSIRLSKRFVEERIGIPEKERGAKDPAWLRNLASLGIEVGAASGDEVRCEVPSYRATKDLTEPIDLVEEIARLRGYDKIAPEPLESPVVPPPSQGARRALVRRVEDRWVGLGFRSVETYSFLPDRIVERVYSTAAPFVTLQGSIVAGESRIRREVLPSLLALVERNLGIEGDLRLFEVGKGYRTETPRVDPYVGSDPKEPREVHRVAGVWARAAARDGASKFDGALFFALKGAVTSFLEGLDLAPAFAGAERAAKLDDAALRIPSYLHPKRSLYASARGTDAAPRVVGFFGDLHPAVASGLGLRGAEVCGFEIDLEALEGAVTAAGARRFVGIPRFPGITVDVALDAPAAIPVGDLEALVRGANPQLCREAALFDVYAGAELGAGRRSVAFHVELRADDRTLAEGDEKAFLAAVAKASAAKGIQLRGWKG